MLSNRIPELQALQVLLAVGRTGSLNAAAAELEVSQQAVSARIRSMEAQTGLVLVERTARGSRLSEHGVVVAEWAARLLDVASELDAGIAALRQRRRASIRVAASLTIAEQLLPGWLVELQADARSRAERPAEVVLQAANSEQVADLVRTGTVELGFVEGPAAPRGLRSRSIGEDRLVVVVRPDHPWTRRQRAVTAAELAKTGLVTREAGSGTRESLERALREHGQQAAEPALALSTTAAVRAAVLAGAGPAVLSELTVADDLAAQRLRVIPVAGLSLERTLRAVWLGGRIPPAGPARDLLMLAARNHSAARVAGRPPAAGQRPASTQSAQKPRRPAR